MQLEFYVQSQILAVAIRTRIFLSGHDEKGSFQASRTGTAAQGHIKMTFKLAPRIAAALEKAREMTGKGKSQLVEASLVAYLHLSSEEES
jgi:hypothetical protein